MSIRIRITFIHSFLHRLSIPTGTPNALPRFGLFPTAAERGQPNPLSGRPQTRRGLSELQWDKDSWGCLRVLIAGTQGAWGNSRPQEPLGVVPDRASTAEAKGAAQPDSPSPSAAAAGRAWRARRRVRGRGPSAGRGARGERGKERGGSGDSAQSAGGHRGSGPGTGEAPRPARGERPGRAGPRSAFTTTPRPPALLPPCPAIFLRAPGRGAAAGRGRDGRAAAAGAGRGQCGVGSAGSAGSAGWAVRDGQCGQCGMWDAGCGI